MTLLQTCRRKAARWIASIMISGLFATGAAMGQSVRINVDYKGLDPIWLSDLSKETRAALKFKNGFLSLPTVTALNDTTATFEVIREVVFLHGGEWETVDCGAIVKLHTIIKEGKIHVSGKSILRRSNSKEPGNPARNPTFHSRETFIDGAYASGRLIKIPIEEDPEGPQLLLTLTHLKANGQPAD